MSDENGGDDIPRQCWALSETTGERCQKSRIYGSDFCSVHRGREQLTIVTETDDDD